MTNKVTSKTGDLKALAAQINALSSEDASELVAKLSEDVIEILEKAIEERWPDDTDTE